MAGNNSENNIFSANDALDINELASLNDDISLEFIEQLQNQLTQKTGNTEETTTSDEKDDTELFEEVQESTEQSTVEQVEEAIVEEKPAPPKPQIDDSIDDNFIKKYKAKLNKQKLGPESSEETADAKSKVKEGSQEVSTPQFDSSEIEGLTGGNIIEKPLSLDQVAYNDSLDYLDNNVKYSKYVIYIDPENTDFIDSLTVKERKNLINKILKEQDDIVVAQRRLKATHIIIKHAVIAILTLAISIPVIYFTINTALEASINNYRRSQSIFQTLYKERGKIKTNINH